MVHDRGRFRSPIRPKVIDRFPDGTVVPGVIISGQYSGDRADVRCAGRWAAGRWALEVVRRLDTGSPYDLPIKTGTYMRVAAFDHAQISTHKTCSAHTLGGRTMTKICKVTINGDVISANPGDLLLDAALINGIDLPHDCRSGYCDTCRVRVVSGRCLGDATDDPDIVHACQTRLIADLSVVVERTPEVTEVSGRIVDLVDIAPDVFEVCIQSARPLELPCPANICLWRFAAIPRVITAQQCPWNTPPTQTSSASTYEPSPGHVFHLRLVARSRSVTR